MRIYIDMDHTFCDFNGSYSYWKDRAITNVEKTWPWSQPGFFRSLLPMEGAIEFWHEFYPQCELWFLTRPSIPNRHCYTEKAEWVHRYLGDQGLERLILSPLKDLFIGDILIDDSNNAGQPTFLGQWWRFGSNEFPDWKTVSERLRREIDNDET